MKYFSEKIKEERKLRKLTQKEVAKALKISITCYAGYEQNYREPDLETFKRICIYFEISSDQAIGLEDDFGNKIYIKDSFNNGNYNGNINIGNKK